MALGWLWVALPRLSRLDVDVQSARPPNTRAALKSVAASLNPKAENRNPKEARNPKSRKTGRAGGWPGQRLKSFSDFGLRISAFGFQGRLRRVRCYRSDFRAALPRWVPSRKTLGFSASRHNLPLN